MPDLLKKEEILGTKERQQVAITGKSTNGFVEILEVPRCARMYLVRANQITSIGQSYPIVFTNIS